VGSVAVLGGWLGLSMRGGGAVSLYQGSGDALLLEVGVVFLVAVIGGWLRLSMSRCRAVRFYEAGGYALLLEVWVVILIAVDCHASASATEPDPGRGVIDIPLVLVVPVKELTLDGRTREAIAMNELVALLAFPLCLGELGADVYVLKS
jgi:hypothetical protein